MCPSTPPKTHRPPFNFKVAGEKKPPPPPLFAIYFVLYIIYKGGVVLLILYLGGVEYNRWGVFSVV